MGIDLRWTEGNSCKLYKTYISKVNCHSLAFLEDACRLDREMMSFTKRSFKLGFQSRPPTLSDENINSDNYFSRPFGRFGRTSGLF